MDNQRHEDRESGKKEYFPPKIVHSEKMTVRTATCSKSDSACAPGPIQS